MSTQVSSFDFDKMAEDWLGAFQIAEQDQRRDVFNRFKSEMRVMRYMEVHQGKITISRNPMVEIMASFKVVRRHADLVKIDLTTVWGFIARDDRAIHAFRPTDKGFDFLFAYVPGGKYVATGVMQITSVRD